MMKFLFVFFLFSTSTYAQNKVCKDACVNEYERCRDIVTLWVEDKFIEAESMSNYYLNREIDDFYNSVRKAEKEKIKKCKDKKKECIEKCG